MNSALSFARPPQAILVACTRRIGDVLLATPLVHSFKQHWPDVAIDMVVFRGTESVLEGNPDIRNVIVVERRAKPKERLADALRLWRRYDLSLAVTSSDRARFYAWFAGRKRVGLVDSQRITRTARLMLHRIAPDHQLDDHIVASGLSLAPLVGVAPVGEVVAPSSADPMRREWLRARLAAPPAAREGQPLAVVHPSPMYRYKQWRVDGWAGLVRWLRSNGYAVALTGGPGDAERAYAEEVIAAAGEPVVNFVGELSFGETADVIRQAKLFVGPDTGATHVAAACGTPTLALFGPSDPVRWGPWPQHWPADGEMPWQRRGSGRQGNVYLLQGDGDCVPCRQEGCERRVDSTSDCLTGLSISRVIAAAAEMLGMPAPHSDVSAEISVPLPKPQR
ncbi:glycosyltransferase family 9 protein [Burkholderia ubonensis]|uniref:LPS core biosynthesis protein n=1 Tax=Burkholderia ubonensis subsp. mesacidophila TaxID=265293 RepID=A0A2A4FGA0_9BURK|nr:glycosyltransferase family 9 protein [Burkholderia ubonensis]PCE32097.1 LPS core biosynthesis protein [Burkholderia ubonensis subsp. mesacidophila]